MTTTCATIQTAWDDHIFSHANVQTITPNVIYHPATQTSESELEALYYNGEINVFEVLIYRTIELVMTQSEVTSYNVKITYYREQNPASTNFESTRALFETLYPLVKSELGTTWDSNVDYFNVRNDAIEVDEITIDNSPCWRTSVTFEGILTEAY